jgi:hypothetical protein
MVMVAILAASLSVEMAVLILVSNATLVLETRIPSLLAVEPTAHSQGVVTELPISERSVMTELKIPGHQTHADQIVPAPLVVMASLTTSMVKFVTKDLATLGLKLMVVHLIVHPTFVANLYISTLLTTLLIFFLPNPEFTGIKVLIRMPLTIKLLTGLSSLHLNLSPNAS